MSQRALDLTRSLQIVRRRKVLVAVLVALGFLIGAAYPVLKRPMLTSTVLVVLPQSSVNTQTNNNSGTPNSYTATQEVIAGSNEVLSKALPDIRPTMSLAELTRELQIGSVTPYIISISTTGRVAADVEANANAVAHSYISYIGSSTSPVGRVSAQLLQSATRATRPSPLKQLIIDAFLGALIAALIAIIVVLAIGRNDRRLRER